LSGIVSYCQVLSGIIRFCQVSLGIIRYHEGLKKHLDDLIPNGDSPVLHCLGITSLVSRSIIQKTHNTQTSILTPNLSRVNYSSKKVLQLLPGMQLMPTNVIKEAKNLTEKKKKEKIKERGESNEQIKTVIRTEAVANSLGHLIVTEKR
jgi:hypothetical protein